MRRARGASLEGSTGPPVSWAAMARVGRLTFTCAAGPSLGRRRTDAWLVCPAGARARVGAGDAPLGEKAFSSDPRGCLWGTAAPSRRPSSVRVVGHWVPLLRPVWLGGGPRATDALPGLPRPAPPPNASGEGHAGPPARVSRRAGWCAPRGEVEARGATRARPRPASDGLPLLLSAPSRLSLARSRPEPRPVGAARGHGSGRLARGWGRGSRFCSWGTRVSRAGPGRWGGIRRGPFPARVARVGPRRRGRAAARLAVCLVGCRGRSASRASRGRPRVWRWDPRGFSRWPVRVLGPRPRETASAARPGPSLAGSRLARGPLLPPVGAEPPRARPPPRVRPGGAPETDLSLRGGRRPRCPPRRGPGGRRPAGRGGLGALSRVARGGERVGAGGRDRRCRTGERGPAAAASAAGPSRPREGPCLPGKRDEVGWRPGQPRDRPRAPEKGAPRR